MAENILAKINIDVKDFLTDIKKSAEFTKQLEQEFDNISKASAFDKANKDVKQLQDSLKKTMATMIVEGKEGTAEFKKLEAQFKQVTAESKKLDDALKKIDGSVQEVGKSGGAMSGILSGIGAGVGIGLATQGLDLLTGALTEAFSAGKELASAQTDLQKKTGLTGEAFNKLKAEAKDAFVGGVGESVAEATKVVATAQNIFAGAIPVDQIGDIAVKAQTLGRLYDKDVNEVLLKSQSFVKQFGIDGDKAFNLIALASQKGGTSQDDVLDSLAEYSQLFVEAGFSAEEFAGVLVSAGEDAQFGTDKIADAIKEAQIRLKAGDTAKAFGDFKNLPKDIKTNLDKALKDAESGQISIKDFLSISGKEIEKGFKEGKITESVRSQLQVAIAGTPAEDIGSEFYGKLFGSDFDTKAIEEQAKKAGKAFEKSFTFDSFFKEITGTVQVLSADLIKIFEPAFGQIASIFADSGEGSKGFIEGIKSIAQVIANILPSIGAFLKITFDLSQMFTNILLKSIQSIASNFSDVFGNQANEGVSFFETLKSVAEGFSSAIEMTVDVVSTYIGLLGTVWGSVFGTILGNYQEGEKGTESFGTKVKNFAETASAGMKLFASIVTNAINSIKPVLSDVGAFIGTFARLLGSVLKGGFDLVVGSITATVNIFKGLKDIVVSVASSISGFVNSLFGASKQTAQTSAVVNQSTGFFSQMGDKITEVGGILNYFTAIIEGVSAVFSNFASGVSEGFKLLSSGEISKGFDSLYNSLANGADAFTKGFNKSVEGSQNRLKGLENSGKKTANILGGLNLGGDLNKATKIPDDKIVPPPVVPPPTTGKAKETESELKKQQKAYEDALFNLTNLQSDYSKRITEIDSDLSLTTEQRAKKKLDVDIDLANQKVALVRKIFKLEGDGITSLSSSIKLAKGEEFRTIALIFEQEFKAKQKLEGDKLTEEKKALEERKKGYLKFIDELIKADEKQFDRFTKKADELAGVKIGDTITRQLIEDLGLEGVEIGSKVDESTFKKATEKAKQSYETALSDIDVKIANETSQETKLALIDQRKEIQEKLDNIEINLKPKPPKTLESSVEEIRDKVIKGLEGISFKIDNSESQKAMKEIEKSIADVNLQFALGKLSSQEYQDQLNELNGKQKEVLDSQETVLGSLQKQLQGVFKSTTDITDQLLKDTALGIADGTKTMTDSFGALGLAFAGVLGTALTDTEDKSQALLRGLFDLASKAVSILLPVILAQYSAFKGPIGTALAGVLTASIVAGLQGIKSALGFEKGGLVPGGEQMIRINEKGQEYVINATSTARNKPILDALNKGNEVRALELLQSKYGNSRTNSTIVVNSDGKLIQAVESLGSRIKNNEQAVKILMDSTEMKFDMKSGTRGFIYHQQKKVRKY